LAVEKAELRKQLIDERRTYSKTEILRNSAIITQRLFELDEVRKAKIISTYIGKEDEVQTTDIIQKSWVAGKTVIVPVVDADRASIYFSELSDLNHLQKGHYDILEPLPEKISVSSLTSADVIIVPGVGWDSRGHRLGHGLGFYDRALENVPDQSTIVGLAFEWQVLESIPMESHDRSVDLIVTETRVISCSDRDHKLS